MDADHIVQCIQILLYDHSIQQYLSAAILIKIKKKQKNIPSSELDSFKIGLFTAINIGAYFGSFSRSCDFLMQTILVGVVRCKN